jgi:hypothetical protein
MSNKHIVAEGDCMESIAKRYGFFADTLWNHPDNRSLHDLRKDQNILLAGDVVMIPELQLKDCPGSTEARHRFRRKGVPARLRMKFYRPVSAQPEEESGGGQYDPSHYEGPQPPQDVEYEPIANARFVLNLDGTFTEGQSDGEGMVDVIIPPDASGGTIKFYPGMPEEVSFDVLLGGMDPIDTVIGVRKRLNNLGYVCLPSGDEMEVSLRDALRQFQTAQNLTTSGEIDPATKDKLKEVHGS